MKKQIILAFLAIMIALAFVAEAKAQSDHPTFSYDLGASTGTYNDKSYSEIQLGLNWYMSEYFIWRNAIFSRFGSEIDSVAGLDTSLRANYEMKTDDGGMALGVFGGPGYRISKTENSGIFGEAGVKVRAGGLALGVGVKSLTYTSPGNDINGNKLPKRDTTVFLILAGGGAF